jgi:hypothetical protein
MASFSWSGRFREGQWRAFRKFALQERKDIPKRERAIIEELDRIGYIRVIWGRGPLGEPTERRLGIEVTPEGSSLSKLLSAYVAMGGNPLDISMFLSPNDALPSGSDQPYSQPGGGVLTKTPLSYSLGGLPNANDGNLISSKASRSGGLTTNPEAPIASLVDRGRKWISKEIRFKRNAIESRIMKLCDLREQLLDEVEDMTWAGAGYGVKTMAYDPETFKDDLTLAGIVYTIDGIFRVSSPDGKVVWQNGERNTVSLAVYPNLMDDLPEEKNTGF